MSRFSITRLLTFLMILAIPVAAFAADPVGRQTGGGPFIEWRGSLSGHDSVTLTVVSPEGDVITKTFKSGRALMLRISDLGTDVQDGQYSYELVVSPKVSPDVARKLEDARAANDDAAAKKIMKAAGLSPIVQSGAFTVQGGSFVPNDLVEGDANDLSTGSRAAGVSTNASRPTGPIAVNDQVIPDDLIVQGSICAGFDCVNNESFGFDTIRLKENNLRIKAEDTSVGTFPTNDWQLTFNDSASGGASKFSVEDITGVKVPFTITAGATTNSIFVDSTGRVGFRTSTPVLDLHVATSNTPALRLEQNNSGGFTAQTWDIAGNEANFFVRDVTSGSRLPFRIRPGAPTSSIDINAEGIVGIGTASPELVNGITRGMQIEAEFPALRLTATGTGGHDYQFQLGNSGQLGISDVTGGTNNNRFFITGTGNIGIGNTAPASKLHVTGDVRVTTGSFIDDGTTLNVPDYVFEDTYKLMPLRELESFIRENRHLPNVPSASAVKAAGLNLSQMQMRLLEKVEELTLYTLDQHKTISELQAQNEALAARLKAIDEHLAKQQ